MGELPRTMSEIAVGRGSRRAKHSRPNRPQLGRSLAPPWQRESSFSQSRVSSPRCGDTPPQRCLAADETRLETTGGARLPPSQNILQPNQPQLGRSLGPVSSPGCGDTPPQRCLAAEETRLETGGDRSGEPPGEPNILQPNQPQLGRSLAPPHPPTQRSDRVGGRRGGCRLPETRPAKADELSVARRLLSRTQR